MHVLLKHNLYKTEILDHMQYLQLHTLMVLSYGILTKTHQLEKGLSLPYKRTLSLYRL